MNKKSAIQEVYETLVEYGLFTNQVKRLIFEFQDIALYELRHEKIVKKRFLKYRNKSTPLLDQENNAVDQIYNTLIECGKTDEEIEVLLTNMCTEFLLNIYDYDKKYGDKSFFGL